LARLVVADADLERNRLARATLRSFLDLAVVERLQGHLAPDHLLLEHLRGRLQAFLRRRLELDRVVLELDCAFRSLEIEARRELALRLVDRVADLLHVDFRYHVEAGHRAYSSSRPVK